ncbi:bifunctional hydroxymethylpyrimidine kinase/phosphomethylpyrimidine kinase [Oceanicola sp. S124]|uniref:bifunctional hydroxymethylpyrimidine kinase/phosphomethylpyrimidine kinase n=1 Tax=Oceanicola sp. S124 TaxID=1042378 RepID=UPI0002558C8A|nr:bifunctional hydroxymethylpyrimidine kinase/phosphomethylpyrimidine kinase [Oceanicola sp. S124]
MIPNVLSIAGSDPSGGAGIQADLKAISANGGYAMAVLTALTAQNTQGVRAARLIEPDFIRAQLDAIFEDIEVQAVKIGMLGSAPIIRCVAEVLSGRNLPVVLDPVMVAKSGDRLLAAEAVAALPELLPLASVITPNLPEAADLLGAPEATSRAGMQDQAHVLRALGARAVLLKGGHLPGGDSPDLLVTETGESWIEAPRIAGDAAHGTGCTLSSALATQLAQGLPLPEACARAKHYISGAIAGARHLSVGKGHGPTDHFFAQRT